MNDETPAILQQILDAVTDLTRVTIAIHGKFESRADAIRRLSELSIPPARIATILAVPATSVHSTLTKARHRAEGGRRTSEIEGIRAAEFGGGDG